MRSGFIHPPPSIRDARHSGAQTMAMQDTRAVRGDFPHAPLTHAEPALESSRDSGFDLSAATGELVDNAFDAGARHIRIATLRDGTGSIVELGVADDGAGISPDVLAAVLSLGFSTRYNSRVGLGRFGMG